MRIAQVYTNDVVVGDIIHFILAKSRRVMFNGKMTKPRRQYRQRVLAYVESERFNERGHRILSMYLMYAVGTFGWKNGTTIKLGENKIFKYSQHIDRFKWRDEKARQYEVARVEQTRINIKKHHRKRHHNNYPDLFSLSQSVPDNTVSNTSGVINEPEQMRADYDDDCLLLASAANEIRIEMHIDEIIPPETAIQ